MRSAGRICSRQICQDKQLPIPPAPRISKLQLLQPSILAPAVVPIFLRLPPSQTWSSLKTESSKSKRPTNEINEWIMCRSHQIRSDHSTTTTPRVGVVKWESFGFPTNVLFLWSANPIIGPLIRTVNVSFYRFPLMLTNSDLRLTIKSRSLKALCRYSLRRL